MTIPSRFKKGGSEYGEGLVICLVKFAEHAERWVRQKERESLSDPVEVFFNGASDHLYGIEVPESWQGSEIAKKVRELQDFELQIGHGFTGEQWSEDDVVKAYDMCREIALMIDEQLGLNPDIGRW